MRWDKQGRLRQATRELGERLALSLLNQESAGLDPKREEMTLRALLAVEDQRAFAIERLAGWLAPSAEDARRATAIAALSSIDDVRAARALSLAWNSCAGNQRAQIFELLLARSTWTGALLDRVQAGELLARQFSAQELHRLRNHPDASIAARAKELLEAARPASAEAISALVAQLLPEVDRAGDAAAGRIVFEQNCAACHTVDGQGGHVGPDLTGMGAHGAAWLLPVILDPNRSVEGAYTEWQARTKDERLVAGILVRESSESVVLRSTAGDVEVRREELAALENSGRSPMPTGFERLGGAALRDLMQYLSGNAAGFRVLDLKPWASASTSAGLFDTRRDAKAMRFRRFGVQTIVGVPYEILDPARTPSGKNALVLKGGLVADWESKTKMPQSCEVQLGFELASVHVLGGIAAWGWPYFQDKEPILKWTWNFSDGSSESVLLHNGAEFADWIGRHDVPQSTFVEDVLEEDSWGQVRRFEVLCPKRALVRSITLESFDNRYAPVVLAMTAQRDPGAGTHGAPLAAESARAREGAPAKSDWIPSDIVIVGGGSSHDFERHWGGQDRATLRAAGWTSSCYVSDPVELAPALKTAKVLVLANNRELPGEGLRSAVFAFVERGGGLVLLHAATWYNWNDWPQYNEQLVGGGSRSHEAYGDFDVEIQVEHPVTAGATKRFAIQDELYRFEPKPLGAASVLAVGRSRSSGAAYTVAWAHSFGKGRIVGLTLGHDGAAHEHADYQRLLVNAVRWVTAPANLDR